ncbi:MAG: ABC transporter permease [Coriobacteriia bacterium]
MKLGRVLRAELLKAQWPLLGFLVVGGGLVVLLLSGGGSIEGAGQWEQAYQMAAIQYSWLFYPLLAGVFAALVCRVEHIGGGWKQALSLPVPRSSVYLAKFLLLAGLLAATSVVFGLGFVGIGLLSHFAADVPWATLGRSLLAGWIAVLPLAAVQLWVSSRWRSFGAALALNVCFTLPAIFAAQSSDIGPWYPWAQPMLAMLPNTAKAAADGPLSIAPETFWIVIVGGFVLALVGGLLTFARRDALT